MKSMRSLYKKLFHYVPDKRILAYFSMALSAAAVCSYMGAYWFLWQSIVSILVIPVYEKAMYDAIIVVILMILRGILNIASATCSHYLGFRLETNLRKNGLHKLLDASSSFFDHNSSGEIRKIIDDNAAETHKTVAHLIPDNVTAVMTPVLMFALMFAIDYRLGILLILTTVIGVLQYRKMSGGTEFLSGYSAALQKMSAATVEYVRGMQIIKIFGVTVQYYKTLIRDRFRSFHFSSSCFFVSLIVDDIVLHQRILQRGQAAATLMQGEQKLGRHVGEVVGIVCFHYGKLVRVLVHIAVQLGIAGQTRILPRPIGNDHSGADKLGDRPIPIRTFFAAIRAVTTGETEQGHKLGSSSSQRLYCAEELLYGHPAAGHNDGARGRCELQPFRILELGQLQNCIGNADIVLRGVFHKIHGGTLL